MISEGVGDWGLGIGLSPVQTERARARWLDSDAEARSQTFRTTSAFVLGIGAPKRYFDVTPTSSPRVLLMRGSEGRAKGIRARSLRERAPCLRCARTKIWTFGKPAWALSRSAARRSKRSLTRIVLFFAINSCGQACQFLRTSQRAAVVTAIKIMHVFCK